MTQRRNGRLLRQLGLLVLCLSAIAYVASEAVRGPHGLIANELLRAKIVDLNRDLTALKRERARLERDADLLGPKASTHSDLLDEQARTLLDLARPADIVIVSGGKAAR
ncbi:septum formation initiator family protein [Rhodomicrobium sp. Az07]|uniref:FtsB family cell division protein n=1 Tax=Rhodomicrobium sp. Az07 TaxID=2839034 RepID=UPI001BE8B5EB|nr:septum formation initiator family protein [Rhodomicrobium sp. Az07]MBT3071114.1 septum formation initiator family protein [Rhodomicrobium sp. Az07]